MDERDDVPREDRELADGYVDLYRVGLEKDIGTLSRLLRAGRSINFRVDTGVTVLHGAAESGDPVWVSELLERGADPNAADAYGLTPLHMAAAWGGPAVVELLLRAGADPNVDTSSPVMENAGEYPLHAASAEGAAGTLHVLLAHGADVHRRDRGDRTALHVAAAHDSATCIDVLVSRGADVNARCEGRWGPRGTPLEIAQAGNCTSAVAQLLEHGAGRGVPDSEVRVGRGQTHDDAAGSEYLAQGGRTPDTSETPLTMLVVRLRFGADGRAELFGFWYFATCELPYGQEGRAGFFGDLLEGRCCQASVRGTADQVREILQVAAALSDEREERAAAAEQAFAAAAAHPGATWEFEDLAAPRGSAYPVHLMARVLGDKAALVARLRARPDRVELDLAPDWSAQDDLLDPMK